MTDGRFSYQCFVFCDGSAFLWGFVFSRRWTGPDKGFVKHGDGSYYIKVRNRPCIKERPARKKTDKHYDELSFHIRIGVRRTP